MIDALEPFKITHRDCRSSKKTEQSRGEIVRLCQWNIERGYKLDGIIKELTEIDADIICLQEIDVNCKRSHCRDTGLEIAKQLHLNYAFLPEFQELHPDNGGLTSLHGNGILSKFDFTDLSIINHRHHPVDWNNPLHTLAKKEPRRGARSILRALINLPSSSPSPSPPIAIYCCHFEVFCGTLSRIHQLSDIFQDSRHLMDTQHIYHQAILGDMNTMGHGIARMSPHYCCDRLRWRSLGMEEGVVWEKCVLACRDDSYHPDNDNNDKEKSSNNSDNNTKQQQINQQLVKWGLSHQVAREALNPYFQCPFPASTTITLDNPKYKILGKSLMKGKLDWVLLRRMGVKNKWLRNEGYEWSDHKSMIVDVELQ